MMNARLRLIRFAVSFVAVLAYLGLSVAMAGGGTVLRDGQVYARADLCGFDDPDGQDCPFCALAKATDLPLVGALPAGSWGQAVEVGRPTPDQIKAPRLAHAHPQVRAPPFMSV